MPVETRSKRTKEHEALDSERAIRRGAAGTANSSTATNSTGTGLARRASKSSKRAKTGELAESEALSEIEESNRRECKFPPLANHTRLTNVPARDRRSVADAEDPRPKASYFHIDFTTDHHDIQ